MSAPAQAQTNGGGFPVLYPCIWQADVDGFVVCVTRRALRRAVDDRTQLAAKVKDPRAREVAIRRKNDAIRNLMEHHCTPTPVSIDPPTNGARRPTPHEQPTRERTASIMAAVAELVALGRRTHGAPDIQAEYDAAYHALEGRIERALHARRPIDHYLKGEEPRG